MNKDTELIWEAHTREIIQEVDISGPMTLTTSASMIVMWFVHHYGWNGLWQFVKENKAYLVSLGIAMIVAHDVGEWMREVVDSGQIQEILEKFLGTNPWKVTPEGEGIEYYPSDDPRIKLAAKELADRAKNLFS